MVIMKLKPIHSSDSNCVISSDITFKTSEKSDHALRSCFRCLSRPNVGGGGGGGGDFGLGGRGGHGRQSISEIRFASSLRSQSGGRAYRQRERDRKGQNPILQWARIIMPQLPPLELQILTKKIVSFREAFKTSSLNRVVTRV